MGKKILLGITGSVAAFLSPMIARELIRHGAIVKPVMTESALKMIGKDLLWWASGEEPIIEITGNLEHISVTGVMNEPVDLMLIAPSTTNTVAKLASGIADTPVSLIASSLMGKGIPLMILCVAHEDLINSPIVQNALKVVKSYGGIIIEPKREEGKAKIPDLEDVIFEVMEVLIENDLDSKHYIIATGPTREYIDDVRFISNPSSGLTGVELAKESKLRGGSVDLIIGPSSINTPRALNRTNVISTDDMINTVLSKLEEKPKSIVILAAAISDFKPELLTEGKIKSGSDLIINLTPTAKLSDVIKKKFPDCKLILYKAESNVSEEELIKRAKNKLQQTNADMIIANDVSNKESGFSSSNNEVIIIDKSGKPSKISGSKFMISQNIITASKLL